MPLKRSGGALAALALAGLAYLFRNRKQVGNTVHDLTEKAQRQFSQNNTDTTTEPQAFTGETQRI